MVSAENLDRTFLNAADYVTGLSHLNYQYTIKSNDDNSFYHSNIYQLDNMTLTYSLVGPSSGVFTRKKDRYKDYIALRFIRRGKETHENQEHHYQLTNQTIGIFDLNTVSYYQRNLTTEGINLFIEKNYLTKNLLSVLETTVVLDASRGMAKYLLDSIFAIVHEFPFCNHQERKLLLKQFIQLFSTWQAQQSIQLELQRTSDMLTTATDYIHAYLWDHHLTLEQTANHCHVSTRTLQQIFAAEQISFSQYVNDLRLTTAAAKLFHTHEEITTIAFQCGFSSSAYFSKRFKDKYKQSPSAYRKYYQASLALEDVICQQEDCCLYRLRVPN